MGCGSSSANEPKATVQRRRLSVGQDAGINDDGHGEGDQELTEDDRGLITGLNAGNVLEIMNQKGESERKYSIGSDQDTGKTSFANKTIAECGDKDIDKNGIGFTCRKGLKPEAPNQDSWCMIRIDGQYTIYGVFDGHGQKGHDVSNFVKETLPKLIIRDPRFRTPEQGQMLKEMFGKMQSLITQADRMKKLSAQMSGTTCTVCIHDHAANKITMAHVADSTAVLGNIDPKSKKTEGTPLTRDHKPDLQDERRRIEKNGGRVVFDGYANHRVYAKNARYPGLNMSRCLGDLMGHQDCGLSSEPEIFEKVLGDNDHLLLLCSDGVWEFITPIEAVNIVTEKGASRANVAADSLAKEAWDRWIKEEGGTVVDDITVICIFLHEQKAKPTESNA